MHFVVNIKGEAKYDIFVGRGSVYGNPFSHQTSKFNTIKVATRAEAVALYKEWLTSPGLKLIGWNKPTSGQIAALRGKVLGCYCKPAEGFLGRLLCHAQILASLANELAIETIE